MSAPALAVDRPLAIHASAVVVGEGAVLLRGPSGAGKSATALGLIEAAGRRGLFGRLVGDDRLLVRAAGGRLIVAPHPRIAGRVERRFVGLEQARHEPCAVALLVADLETGADAPEVTRLPAETMRWTCIAGVRLPRLLLPAGLPNLADTILECLWSGGP